MSKSDAATQVRNGFLTAAGAAVFGVVALWLLRRPAGDDAAAGGIVAAGGASSTGGLSTLTADNIAGAGIVAAPAGYTTTLTADNLPGGGDCLCGGGCAGSTGSGGGSGPYIGRPVPVDEGYYGGPVGGGVPFFSSVM